MDIVWFPICGYEGLYEWSPTLEAVRSLPRNTTSGKVLKWMYDSDGRPYVTLCKDGVARNFRKAALIYSHTNQCEIPKGFQVHHIDFDWTNNDPNNLQLLTEEEHRELHAEAWTNTRGTKAVIALDDNGNVVYRFASTREASRNGFHQSHVSAACRGCYSTHKGHFYKGLWWYFEDEWLAMQHKPLIKQDGQLLLQFQ